MPEIKPYKHVTNLWVMYECSPMTSPGIENDKKYVKSEMQMPETKFEEDILPVDDTTQPTTWRGTESDPDVEVKSEKVESEAGGSGETRRWVVCESSVLKEVKVESTDWNPDTRETPMCNENIDQEELCNKTNDEVDDQPTNVRPYVCGTCGKSFKQARYRATHESIHTSMKPYTCVTCGKSFRQSGYLTEHKRIHTNSKPFACITCGKSFGRSTHLSDHKRIHTNSKPFACVTCGKSFRRSSNLTVHTRIHTNSKPFPCVICGKSFRRSSQLTVHTIIHTDSKSYACVTCGKSFRGSNQLIEHERIHYISKLFSCVTSRKSF